MTDEEALIASIRANPGDDLPRLIYADWLDERDHPGGQYLRRELELSHLPLRGGKAPALRREMIELRKGIAQGGSPVSTSPT